MRIGLKQILLIAAVILFVVAAIANGSNTFDYLAIGLACLAGALVVDELGFGRGKLGRR